MLFSKAGLSLVTIYSNSDQPCCKIVRQPVNAVRWLSCMFVCRKLLKKLLQKNAVFLSDFF